MPVERVLDHVREVLEVVWDARRAPEDEVLYDLSLDVRDYEGQTTTVVSIFLALMMPESGVKVASTCHAIMPIQKIFEGDLTGVADSLWDHVQSARMGQGLGVLDDPTG